MSITYSTEKHRIFGRVGYAPYSSYSTLPGWPLPRGPFLRIRAPRRMISLTSTFSPNLIGEARISYTRLQFNTYPGKPGLRIGSLGFGPPLTSNVLYQAVPAINVQTYNSVVAWPQRRPTRSSPNDFDPLGGATRTLNPRIPGRPSIT